MITDDVKLGANVSIPHPELVNLYGCTIGEGCKIASFVEIQRGVIIGKNVKIEAFAFICSGVTIEDGAFIGPRVCFTNDKLPRSVGPDGEVLKPGEWTITPTIVRRRASIGAGSTIMCGISIGENALIGAGSVVTADVKPNMLAYGDRARMVRDLTAEDW